MVGFPAKQAKTVEEEQAWEVFDHDSKVKAFKDTLDFPSIDSFLDFDSVNWLASNRNIEQFSIEDKDFDFFEDQMEMGQEAVTVTDELRPVNQTTAEEKPSLCNDIPVEVGVSSIRSESMAEVKPVLCDVMVEEIGESSVKTDSMIEVVEPKIFDDMSANFDSGVEPAVKESEPVVSNTSRPMEGDTEPVSVFDASITCPTMNMDESEAKKAVQGLASSIEVGLEKVSLTMDDDEKSDGVKGKTDCAESESQTSSSSSLGSSDSSSSEEEESEEEESEKEMKFEDQMIMGKEYDVAGELEEGEIEDVDEDDEYEVDDDDDEVNEMVAWGDDGDEDLGLQTKEPIRSKNELKELPPVPAVDKVLEPHHITLPVGVILSIMSTQVIVEGMERHCPLHESSILWITEKRTPLGLVDEIFGPVKCPYYIVRFNSESDVPEGISPGTPVSYVADFAKHILNIKDLQKKGYDASGDNDEEIADELEFSDDEKEAEYRSKQKMEKRGMMNDQKTGNTRNKKKKNRDLVRPTDNYSGEWTENKGSNSLSSIRSDHQIGGPLTNLHSRPQMNGFPPNNAAWRPQNSQQNPYQLPPIPNQMGIPNVVPMQIPLMAMQNQNQMMFQPQFNGGQMPMPGGLNFFPGQASAPWPALVGQNCFNQQPFGMGRGIQQSMNELSFNLLSQGLQMHRPQSPVNPQFQMLPQFQTHPQSPMNPQFQMLHPQQSPMNQQFQMQPQSEPRPQLEVPQSPTNPQPPVQPQSQGFNSGQSSERGRGFRGRGPRGRFQGRGRFRGGRGRGRQQSE